MRRGPILIGTILVMIAFAVQISYDAQFRTLMFGQSAETSPQGLGQRPAASAFLSDVYIRVLGYLIGAAGVMSIIVGSSIQSSKASEVS